MLIGPRVTFVMRHHHSDQLIEAGTLNTRKSVSLNESISVDRLKKGDSINLADYEKV